MALIREHGLERGAMTARRRRGKFSEYVIRDLLEWQRRGMQTCLITLIAVDGSAPRPVGSQMAVCETGEWVGSITSGCAETALVEHARSVMQAGAATRERFGQGSKYFDIQLPCGSGIDVHFQPKPPTDVLAQLNSAVQARRPVRLDFPVDDCGDARSVISDIENTPPLRGGLSRLAPDGSAFSRAYLPNIRLVAAGRGHALTSIVRQAHMLGWDIVAQSPDNDELNEIGHLTASTRHLSGPSAFDAGCLDAWSAGVVLFHDHDWEPDILTEMLASPAFYTGALGSRRTHQARCEILEARGVAQQDLARIRAPVGLDIGGLNPPEITLSILAEITAVLNAKPVSER